MREVFQEYLIFCFGLFHLVIIILLKYPPFVSWLLVSTRGCTHEIEVFDGLEQMNTSNNLTSFLNSSIFSSF